MVSLPIRFNTFAYCWSLGREMSALLATDRSGMLVLLLKEPVLFGPLSGGHSYGFQASIPKRQLTPEC